MSNVSNAWLLFLTVFAIAELVVFFTSATLLNCFVLFTMTAIFAILFHVVLALSKVNDHSSH